MQVQVTIPSISIPGEIGRRLLNLGRNVDSDELEATIKKVVAGMFVRRYKDNAAVLEKLKEHKKFIIEVQDDMADLRPKHLALFNLHRSQHSDAVHFSVSSHLVYVDLLPHYGLADAGAHPPEEYWSHELIHLLDWKMLSTFRADFESTKKGNHASSLFGLDFETRGAALPREWEVLLVLASFRDEGLATLYPYLTGESEIEIPPQEARELFRRLFAPIMQFARRPCLSWSADESPYSKEYLALREELHKLAYLAGPYFVIDAILCFLRKREGNEKYLLSLVEETVQRMSKGQPAAITRRDAARIIDVGLHLNLCCYLELSIDKMSEHPWGPFVDLEEISGLYNFISYCGTEPSDGFMDDLYKSILYNDRECFLEALKEIIGYPMERTEIEAEHQKWLATKAKTIKGSAMLEELYARLDHLEQRYRTAASTDEDKIIAIALTYVFDPEDYIKDKTAVVGHLDDLYVLRAACSLLGIKVRA